MRSPRRLVILGVLLTLAMAVGYPVIRILRQQAAVTALRRPGLHVEIDPPWFDAWVKRDWYTRNLGTVRRVRIVGRITVRDLEILNRMDTLRWLEFDTASEKAWLNLPTHIPKLAIGLPDAGLSLAARRQLSRMQFDELMIRRMVGDGTLPIDVNVLEPLGKLPRLKSLDLIDATVSGDFLLDLVLTLPNLKRLEIRNAGLQDEDLEPLSHLAHLQELRLRDNHRLTDACLSHLGKLPSLRILKIDQWGGLTEPGLDGLRSSRPDVQIITNQD